jgi:hypothetical protein
MEPITLGSLVGEVFKEGATRIVEALLRRIMARRAEAARSILLEEVKQGRATIPLGTPDADEFVAILWRYLRAAEEGTARLNLRLMASVIAGQLESGEVWADTFLRWADLLGALSRQEIVLLAALFRHQTTIANPARLTDQHAQEAILNAQKEADRLARIDTIGTAFTADEEFDLTAQALLRTGLVRQVDGGVWSVGLPPVFAATHRMGDLARLADIEGAIGRDASFAREKA